jgi:hypothetical protein
MSHSITVLSQITKIIKRHEFESMAKQHHTGQKLRSFNRWSQFIAMTVAQLASRKSLRDLVDNLQAQKNKLYHMGLRDTNRATLARVNEQQPYTLYEALFQKLLSRCQNLAPTNRFKLKGKLYLLDTTTIDLCLDLFPWAHFRKAKGAVKLHVGLDVDGYLPTFINATDGKTHEVNWARTLKLPKGSFAVFDRGFTDYKWYQTLIDSNVFFVTRLKSNALLTYFKKRPGRKSKGIIVDREIMLKGISKKLRLVQYIDPETGIEYRFVTNAFHVPAKTVAELYKERWQIELFFKWIKQNLKVKTFLGTSRNAVLTQLWIALCAYLILAWLKFMSKINLSMQQMLRLLQLSLFERRDLFSLFKPPQIVASPQLSLLGNL